ncbi:MAG: PQQ-dependent sugar dehydrogenase [Planctomycetaceae bacterium]
MTAVTAAQSADAQSKTVAQPASNERPYGLNKREPWITSRIVGSPDPSSPFKVERVFQNLGFVNPVELVRVPASKRLLVAELGGNILTFPNRSDVASADLAMNLRDVHPDLTAIYGFAFHPRFAENHYCYIAYVIGSGIADGSRVARFKVTSLDPPRIDPASEEIIITWLSGGHNGACLQFGNDGFLYISTGDGAGPFPPDSLNAGQDVSNLLCAILRIDVDKPDADKKYSIPKDNPFVDLAGARGEKWAYGFRNPWKMSVDHATGALWVGDVGWELWEMIYRVEKGGNYGWSIMEGPQPVHEERKRGPTPILPPTAAHSHIESRSITGGYVYHGNRLADLRDAYIYGDYETGKIWGLRHDGKKVTWQQELADTTVHIVCFGVDAQDELYIVDYGERAALYRLIPNPARTENRQFPTRLSETGLFRSVKDHDPQPGVLPYRINAEPWSDHAVAERFVALPAITAEQPPTAPAESAQAPSGAVPMACLPPKASGVGASDLVSTQICNEKGVWTFPNNAVLAKTISIETERGNPKSLRRLETQILHYDVDVWRPYTYIWNDEQNDAVLADATGTERTIDIIDPEAPGGRRRQTWRFASRTECLLCHNAYDGGSVCGFNTIQLNRDCEYGDVVDNQLHAFSHVGVFTQPLDANIPRLTNPHDATANVGDRARSYLHANCSHCHRSGGGGTALINLRYDSDIAATRLLGTRPTQGTFGLHGAEIVAASDRCRSVLFYRMAKLGRGRMPHLGSSLVDEAGLRLMGDWIESLTAPATAAANSAIAAREHRQRLLAELCAGKHTPGERQPLIGQLLSSTSGALMLVTAIDEATLPREIRDEVVRAGAAHADVQVRDLFERFVPESQRVQRLGNVIKPEQLLSIAGDVARGRQTFFNTSGIVCKNCHRIGKEGKQVGPELTEVGKKNDRAKLLESMLEPSKVIDPKFAAWVVETKDGLVHTGLLVERTDKAVVLKDADDKTLRIANDNVETLVPQSKSLMPELLLRDMTAQQVADLLAFLESLK